MVIFTCVSKRCGSTRAQCGNVSVGARRQPGGGYGNPGPGGGPDGGYAWCGGYACDGMRNGGNCKPPMPPPMPRCTPPMGGCCSPYMAGCCTMPGIGIPGIGPVGGTPYTLGCIMPGRSPPCGGGSMWCAPGIGIITIGGRGGIGGATGAGWCWLIKSLMPAW